MRKMRFRIFSVLLFCLVAVAANAQVERISMTFKNESLSSAFKRIEKVTAYRFVFAYEDVEKERVTGTVRNETIGGTMRFLLKGRPLDYNIEGRIVRVNRRGVAAVALDAAQTSAITGIVYDSYDNPAIGASIKVVGTKLLTVTDANGRFFINTDPRGRKIQVSYVGEETAVVETTGKSLTIHLKSQDKTLKDVVVTGIYSRNRESFTGSASTYTAKELKMMGSQNVLQSLKTLDPAFNILESTEFGSDPNRLPNMEIRGKSSMLGLRDDINVDPNQPLFILDGFESTLQAINDLDINRIETITILKDAASTAIYGSKAANGVVVVETVKPKAGRLQVSYTGSMDMSIPDLSSYNMMDASEKLEFERLAGRYDPSIVETPYLTGKDLELTQMYHDRLREIAQGVNTDWLAQPLRVGVDQKHSLYVMGGNEAFMFGIGGQYNGVAGVMKGSDRKVYTGNVDLIYRVKKFQFSNKLTVSDADYSNPLVSFSDYVSANPYYKMTDADGQLTQWLQYTDNVKMANPLWNASLNSRDTGNDMSISNYFNAEWNPTAEWKVRARIGITYTNSKTEKFVSPENTDQILNKTQAKRGEYTATHASGLQYEGDFTVTFAKLLAGIHRLNFVAGANIFSSKTTADGYTAEGFPSGDFTYPSFAAGYQENGVPSYSEIVSRSANAYMNAGYALMDRYLVDLSLRENGSSVFGSSKRWNTTWSVGLGWNLHKERFMRDLLPIVNYMKLRASIGNPGNQNFESGSTLITYALRSGMLNYFGLGALPNQIGNPNLEWQITQDKNVGLDLALMDNRLSLTVDYYHKVTDPLLIGITMPLSSGTTSYYTNAGKQTSQGLNFTANYYILRNTANRLFWSVRATGRMQKVRISDIGNKLDAFNNNGRGSYTQRYYDGSDPDDIWVIKSAGIDPSTGKELFYDKDGHFTYDFSYDNEVKCGNSRPDLEGVLGTSFTLGGLSLSLNFRYQLGADVFNYALRNKVENVDYNYNQDKRALYERWQKAGDVTSFKNIRDINSSPMSSRFIQKERTLALESVNLQYEWLDGWVKRLNLSSLKVFVSMRDVFRLSTIKAERGTSYPYAKTINAGLSLNF